MANKQLFKSSVGKQLPATDAINEAGGIAYKLEAKHALAQYAVTGCLRSTYYAREEDQLTKVLDLCKEVDPKFIAQTAIYCREKGFMKDMPALLLAVLSAEKTVIANSYTQNVFFRVIDNTKMLRNFCQIVRSGVTGRKSFGTMPKRLIRNWLDSRDEEDLFRGSIGQDPSLPDIIKMVHPKPSTAARKAFYGYLLGKEHNKRYLPKLVKEFEAFKADTTKKVPDVPFQMLTALNLSTDTWVEIAKNAPWHMTRMNLNTFLRHGIFDKKGMTKLIAKKLADKDSIKKAKVFPYQLLIAYLSTSGVPAEVKEALQDAMEIAIENIPAIEGKIYIFPDISGSMRSPITGYQRGSTSAVLCIQVAALIAAALLRNNKLAEVIPFEYGVVDITLNPRDSVMTNAKKLAAIGGGGTACSAPLIKVNKLKGKGDMVIYISDNQSWADFSLCASWHTSTRTLAEWEIFKKNNPKAKLVCIDLQPDATTQAKEREDILNIGGFSDQVFDLIAAFSKNELDAKHWVGQIEKVEL